MLAHPGLMKSPAYNPVLCSLLFSFLSEGFLGLGFVGVFFDSFLHHPAHQFKIPSIQLSLSCINAWLEGTDS